MPSVRINQSAVSLPASPRPISWILQMFGQLGGEVRRGQQAHRHQPQRAGGIVGGRLQRGCAGMCPVMAAKRHHVVAGARAAPAGPARPAWPTPGSPGAAARPISNAPASARRAASTLGTSACRSVATRRPVPRLRRASASCVPGSPRPPVPAPVRRAGPAEFGLPRGISTQMKSSRFYRRSRRSAFWAFAARHGGLALKDLSCGLFRAWKTRKDALG